VSGHPAIYAATKVNSAWPSLCTMTSNNLRDEGLVWLSDWGGSISTAYTGDGLLCNVP